MGTQSNRVSEQPRTRLGVVGCGTISDAYLSGLATFDFLDVVALADLDLERARARAQQHGVARACTVDELLADDSIELVVNLTIPAAHAEVSLAAIDAGKSVYSEKPLAIEREQGRQVVDAARARGVLLGGAPDTFLGGGLQTSGALLDSGTIGTLVGATATFMNRGPESWHPNPAFYYARGGGPLFDMAPYYLTALVAFFGPVRRVSASAVTSFAERVANSAHHQGLVIRPEVPTHVTSVLEFASGAVANLTASFDVWKTAAPPLEIYGSEGTLQAPDPNTFGGPVQAWDRASATWSDQPLTHGYREQCRGIGVADLARALQTGRTPRASGDLTFHVLDLLCTIVAAAEEGRWLDVVSTCERPLPLPPGRPDGDLD